MTALSQLIHRHAYLEGVRGVRVIRLHDPYFLLVELPNGTQAYVYLSTLLRCKINRYLNELGSTDIKDFYGAQIRPVKQRLGIAWEIVQHSPIPEFLRHED